MSQRPVAPVGEDLLDDGVVTVLAFGLDELEWGVGKDGVVRQAGNSSPCPAAALAFRSRTRRMISRAVIALPFLAANAV